MFIFRVVLQDITGCKEFTVFHEDARILLHTTATQLDMYATQVFLLSLLIMLTQVIVLPLPNLYYCCPQPYGHTSLYAIINYYIGKLWVFILEPPQRHEVEVSVALIVLVNWEEEVHYIQYTNVRYTRSIMGMYELQFYHC